jgi:hypothetical protein
MGGVFMRHRIKLLSLVLIGAFSVAVPVRAVPTQVADDATIKLEQEVAALTTLNDLILTKDQLVALRGMIADSAGTSAAPPAPITDGYKAALQTLRTTLLGKDQTKIDDAQDKADNLEDTQDTDSDAEVDQSEPAKDKAPGVLAMLSAKQVANFISQNADDVDSPMDLLLDALHHVQGLTRENFISVREDTAEQIGVFYGFSHPGKPLPIVAKVNRFLVRVHRMPADQYHSQQSSLEEEARQLIGTPDPIPCLRFWMENDLADLLSNPQLGQALTDLGVAAGK